MRRPSSRGSGAAERAVGRGLRAARRGRGRGSGKHPQTTPPSAPASDCVTITLPVHPFRGCALPIVRCGHERDGRCYIDVEHPYGGSLRLPIEWTDRSAPLVPARVNGRELKLDARDLLRLARALEAHGAEGGTVEVPSGGRRRGSHEQTCRSARSPACRAGLSEPPAGRMVDAERDHPAESDRGVGHARSQGAPRRSGAVGRR
jgi:hypothetical protein